MTAQLLIYLTAGAGAGTAAGLLGIGGGVIVVPLLLVLFGLEGIEASVAMHLAVGTSLGTIVFTTLGSALSHYRLGAVELPAFRRLGLGLVAGAAAGAALAGLLPAEALKRLFGAFLLLGVPLMLLKPVPERHGAGRPAGMLAAGGGIGTLSAMLGVGGGILAVPYLIRQGLPMHRAVATSAACMVPLATCGALGFIAAGWGDPRLPAGATGFVYWPALLGIAAASLVASSAAARLAHRVPARLLQRLFALLLVVVGLRLLLS